MQNKLQSLLAAEIDPAFVQRARLIFKTVEQLRPRRILDMGCGRGFYVNSLSLLTSPKEIWGVDVNPKYLAIAKKQVNDKRVKLKKGSVYELPFKTDYFDLIILSEVLEHLKDEEKALRELKRVLKKDGILIVTVPHHNFPFFWDPLNWILMKLFKSHVNKDVWWLAGIWADHKRLYREDELKHVVQAAGFKLSSFKKVVSCCWPFTHFLLYAIGKNIVEKFNTSAFNRFDVNRPKPISKLLARFMAWPDKFSAQLGLKSKASVNLVCVLKKS